MFVGNLEEYIYRKRAECTRTCIHQMAESWRSRDIPEISHSFHVVGKELMHMAALAQLSQSTLPCSSSLTQSLSQPPLGSNSSLSSALRTSNYRYPSCSFIPSHRCAHPTLCSTFLNRISTCSNIDCGSTPIIVRPFPGNERDERSTLRLSALEFMISLSKARRMS